MTKDEIMRLAREACFRTGFISLSSGETLPFIAPVNATSCIVELERFATLVAAKERESRQQAQREAEALRERIVKSGLELHRAVREAVKSEREACAQVCDLEAAKWPPYPSHANAAVTVAATAIRARKETK